MKRYWVAVGLAYRVLGSTLMFSPGETIFVKGVEATVIGSYKGS